MSNDYSDIINMKHHRSAGHAPMSALARAAQFSPFAALTGFDGDIEETAEGKLGRYDEKGRLTAEVEDWVEPC